MLQYLTALPSRPFPHKPHAQQCISPPTLTKPTYVATQTESETSTPPHRYHPAESPRKKSRSTQPHTTHMRIALPTQQTTPAPAPSPMTQTTQSTSQRRRRLRKYADERKKATGQAHGGYHSGQQRQQPQQRPQTPTYQSPQYQHQQARAATAGPLEPPQAPSQYQHQQFQHQMHPYPHPQHGGGSALLSPFS